jgi:hypothetical protein
MKKRLAIEWEAVYHGWVETAHVHEECVSDDESGFTCTGGNVVEAVNKACELAVAFGWDLRGIDLSGLVATVRERQRAEEKKRREVYPYDVYDSSYMPLDWDQFPCFVFLYFRGIGLPNDPSWASWQGGVVARMMECILGEKAWNELPVLADALEDAGCEDGALLRWLRLGTIHDGEACALLLRCLLNQP